MVTWIIWWFWEVPSFGDAKRNMNKLRYCLWLMIHFTGFYGVYYLNRFNSLRYPLSSEVRAKNRKVHFTQVLWTHTPLSRLGVTELRRHIHNTAKLTPSLVSGQTFNRGWKQGLQEDFSLWQTRFPLKFIFAQRQVTRCNQNIDEHNCALSNINRNISDWQGNSCDVTIKSSSIAQLCLSAHPCTSCSLHSASCIDSRRLKSVSLHVFWEVRRAHKE